MSSLKSRIVIPGITEESPIPEMIAVLHSTFRKEKYDEVERLLVLRESKMETELQDLRGKYELLQRDHSRAVLNENSVGEELKSCRAALHESQEQVYRLRAIGEMACKRHGEAQRQLESVAGQLLKMEEEKDSEMAKKINELAKANVELEKLRMDKKISIEGLMSEVGLLQQEVAKELEYYVMDNTSNDCQQMDVEVEGGLAVSSPEVINRSVSPQQFNNGENGVNDQVGGEEIQREPDESVGQTALGGNLTVEDLQNVISAAIKDVIAPLIPVAVTNRSLSPLVVSSDVNDQNETTNLDQITPEAIKVAPLVPVAVTNRSLSPLEVGYGVNDQNETTNLYKITPEAIDEATRSQIHVPFFDLTLSPQKISESETIVNGHDHEEAVPSANRSSYPQGIIQIDDSEDESSALKRQRKMF